MAESIWRKKDIKNSKLINSLTIQRYITLLLHKTLLHCNIIPDYLLLLNYLIRMFRRKKNGEPVQSNCIFCIFYYTMSYITIISEK